METIYAVWVGVTAGFDGRPVVVAHEGRVGGTLSIVSRDDSWDETATAAAIADDWAAVKQGASSTKAEFGTGTGSFEIIKGLAATGGGIFVFKL